MTSKDSFIKVGGDSDCRHPFRFDLKGHNEISQIFISADGEMGITSIQFQYMENGKYVLSKQYGTLIGANKFHTIDVNHPTEYITGVGGQYTCGVSSLFTSDMLRMVTFTTNIKEYGPFGLTNSNQLSKFSNLKSFAYNLGKSCQFGGFHGSHDSYALCSIGFYINTTTIPTNSGSKTPKKEAK